mgnify:CR=1 FL=1
MKKRSLFSIVLIALLLSTGAFAEEAKPSAPLKLLKGKDAPEITEVVKVLMVTDAGDLTIEVYPQAAPNAAKRFLELVEAGYYDGTPLFRVVKQPKPFVAQFGINSDMAEWKEKNFDDDPDAVTQLVTCAVETPRRFDHLASQLRQRRDDAAAYAAKIGEQAPLHATAAGKVFLAYDSNPDRCGLPDDYELEKLTEHTITNLRKLELDLAKVRQRGYALCDREEFLQISGIAVPIFDYQSRAVASLSLWAPTKLASTQELIDNSAALIETASEISKRFGSMVS